MFRIYKIVQSQGAGVPEAVGGTSASITTMGLASGVLPSEIAWRAWAAADSSADNLVSNQARALGSSRKVRSINLLFIQAK